MNRYLKIVLNFIGILTISAIVSAFIGFEYFETSFLGAAVGDYLTYKHSKK